MTEETGAAAPTDVSPPQGAVTESKPATQEQSVPQDAASVAETAEPNGDGQSSNIESSEDDKPRKPSRSERMRRRMQAMATELDGLRAQLGAGSQQAQPEAPKEADFNGDYFAFQAAKIAHETKQALRSEFDGERQRNQQERLAQTQREMVEDFEERAEEFRTRIPDFDKTIESFVTSGGKFSPALIEELQASEMGPALAYQLAKNPQKAAELSAMSPREVAREIGRLEGKSSLPNPKKQTSAPAPLTVPSGGASPPADLRSLAKNYDATAYITARNQQEKARAKS